MNMVRTVRLPTILGCVALFGTLAAAPPTMGEETDALEPTRDAKEAAYTKRSVCKKETVVGTRISKTVCRTPAQTDEERAASQDFLKDVQQNATLQRKTME